MCTGLVTVLALTLSIAVCASANAATVHRQRARPHITVDPSRGVTAPAGAPRVAVPGWSDEDTRRWMDNASALWQGA